MHPAAPAPPLAMAWAALVFLLVTMTLMYPALGGNFLVNPWSDQFGGAVYRQFAAEAITETGGFPLWNPYVLGGLPFVAAQHGDIFYPTFLLRLAFSVDVAMNLSFGIHIFLCGLFAYGFLRAWGVGFYAALVGGIAYMLSGQIASLVSPGHDGKLYVSALAPALLWMILLGVRDRRLWAWGGVAVIAGLCVLSPHYQMTYYLAVLAGAWTLFLLFSGSPPLTGRERALRLGMAAGAALLGAGIGAIQFAPFFEYIPFSPRAEGGRGWEYAISWSMPPEELVNIYLPQFSGILENYWGRNFFKLHGEYIGASVLVLAGAAFGARAHRRFVWFWIGASIWALLVAVGGHTPFYRLWYLMPMMSVVRAPSMIFYIVSLAAACLAAVGTERILRSGIGYRYLIGWGIAALVIAVLGTLGVLSGIATSLAPAERYQAALANAPDLMAGAWRSFLFVLLTVGALFLVIERRVSPLAGGAALAAIITADLWTIDRHYFRWSPPARELYAADPAIRYLQQIEQPGRVAALPLAELAVPNDPFLRGDALVLHRVRAVTGHQGNELQRWIDLAGAKSPQPPPNIFNREFRRLANVRYLLTNVALPEEVPEAGLRLALRVGPVANSVGTLVYLYELEEEDNPVAWVAPVRVAAPPEPTLATVLDPRFDPGRAAIFDTAAAIATQQITALPDPLPISATVRYPQPGRISVSLDAPAPEGSALVISENHYPGWSASSGGAELPVGLAQYSFIGVALPAGVTAIELTFSQRSYAVGRLLTLVALLVAAGIIAFGVVTERRARG